MIFAEHALASSKDIRLKGYLLSPSTQSNSPRHDVSFIERDSARKKSSEGQISDNGRNSDHQSVGQSYVDQDVHVDGSVVDMLTSNQIFSRAEASETRSPKEGPSELRSQTHYDDNASKFGDENFVWDDSRLSFEQMKAKYSGPDYVQNSLTANADGSHSNLPLHHSLEDLQTSTSNGCRLCTLIW